MWRMGLYRKISGIDTLIVKNEYLESDFSPIDPEKISLHGFMAEKSI